MQKPQRNIARQIVEALLQAHGKYVTTRELYKLIGVDSRRVSDTLSVFEALDLINRKDRQYMLPSADEVYARHERLFEAPQQSSQQPEEPKPRTISALAVCVVDACREQPRTIGQLRDELDNSRRIYDAMNVLKGLGVLESSDRKIQMCYSLWWHQALKYAERDAQWEAYQTGKQPLNWTSAQPIQWTAKNATERPTEQASNYFPADAFDKSLYDLTREALESLNYSYTMTAGEMTKNPAIGATPKRSQGYCFKTPPSDGFK